MSVHRPAAHPQLNCPVARFSCLWKPRWPSVLLFTSKAHSGLESWVKLGSEITWSLCFCLDGILSCSVSLFQVHMHGLRESQTLVAVQITFMGHFFWVSFGQSSCSAWFWVCIQCISGSSHVCTHISWPRWILAKRPMGSWYHLLWGGASSLSDLQRVFLPVCSLGGLLNFKNQESAVFYLLSGQGPACFSL